MPYKYQGRIIRVGRGWQTVDGIKHPSSWNRWSDEEKAEQGLVWEDDEPSFDSRFYWSAGNPKAIDDVTETDEAGNVSVTKGLKSVAIEQTKATAGSLLAPTDWYIVREQETGDTTPVEVLAYRQAVREASGDIEAAIVGVTTHEAFMALYNAPVDAEGNVTGNAPINDWPEA